MVSVWQLLDALACFPGAGVEGEGKGQGPGVSASRTFEHGYVLTEWNLRTFVAEPSIPLGESQIICG